MKQIRYCQKLNWYYVICCCYIVTVIGWESKGVYGSKLIALHGAFLPKHKIF